MVNKSNLHQACEDLLNKQINYELNVSNFYLTLSVHFNNSEIGLTGIAKFFNKMYEEERQHSKMFMDYLNERCGNVLVPEIEKYSLDFLFNDTNKSNILLAMEKSLEKEIQVNKYLLELHKKGDECNDPQLCDYLEGNFLNEQVQSIYELSHFISQLKLIGNDGYGLYEFNNKLLLN